MIEVTNIRVWSGEEQEPIIVKRTPDRAFESLVIHEIGFNGRLTVLTDTEIQIVTCVFNTVDTTIFRGSVQEMQLLYEAAFLSQLYSINSANVSEEYKNTIIDSLIKATGGKALFIVHASPILIGKTVVFAVLSHMINVEKEEHLKYFANMDMKDFAALTLLVRNNNLSIDEALLLAA